MLTRNQKRILAKCLQLYLYHQRKEKKNSDMAWAAYQAKSATKSDSLARLARKHSLACIQYRNMMAHTIDMAGADWDGSIIHMKQIIAS